MLMLGQNKINIVDTSNIKRIIKTPKHVILATLDCDSNTGNTYDILLGEYYTDRRCEEIMTDIIKKAEVGCKTYIIPKE